MAEQKPIPKEQKILLGVLAVAGVYMFITKVYIPQETEIKKLQEEIDKTNKTIANIKVKIARMDQLEADYELLKASVADAEKKLPRSEELPGLIRGITSLGTKHGIEIDNMRIGNVSTMEYYKAHFYNFSVVASYHKIAQFFSDVCQEERIMSVNNIMFSPGTDSAGKVSLTVTFKLVVYAYKS